MGGQQKKSETSTLGKVLLHYMSNADYKTMAELARDSSLEPSYLASLVSGKRWPANLGTLNKIAIAIALKLNSNSSDEKGIPRTKSDIYYHLVRATAMDAESPSTQVGLSTHKIGRAASSQQVDAGRENEDQVEFAAGLLIKVWADKERISPILDELIKARPTPGAFIALKDYIREVADPSSSLIDSSS